MIKLKLTSYLKCVWYKLIDLLNGNAFAIKYNFYYLEILIEIKIFENWGGRFGVHRQAAWRVDRNSGNASTLYVRTFCRILSFL